MTKIINSKNLYKGYLEVNQLTLENKGDVFTRDWLQVKDAVCAVVYNNITKNYLFVKQFRVGSKKDIIELCAGIVENESPENTIIREISEELGYKVDTITQLLKQPFYVSPGKTNEKIWLYYVTVSQKTGNGGGLKTENEDIEIISVSKKEIKNLEIEDGKTLLALSIIGFGHHFQTPNLKLKT
jgi:ADP-ribose pyrophosphatase